MSRTLQGLGLLFARGAATCSPVTNGLTAPLLICRTRLQNVCLETKMQLQSLEQKHCPLGCRQLMAAASSA